MNILFVTSWYPREDHPSQGIFIKEHAKAVASEGHQVVVLNCWPVKADTLFSLEYSRYETEGIDVHQNLIRTYFPGLFYNVWPVLYLISKRNYLSEIAGRFDPDLIHGHVVYPAGFVAEKLARTFTKPYVLTEHWTKTGKFLQKPLYGRRAARVYRKASGIFPVSRYLKSQFRDVTGPNAFIQVIPNVVGEDLFNYTPSPEKRDEAVLNLLCVTNFIPKKDNHKRPDLIISALDRLSPEEQQRVRVLFVGPGSEQHSLRETVDERGLEAQIVFKGPQEKAFIAEKMKEADFLVHPSEKETFGVVVAEALSCGLPCVASRIGALPELIDEESGILLGNSVDDWASVIRELLKGAHQFDRAAIARRYASRFSYASIGRQLTEAYRRVLSAR